MSDWPKFDSDWKKCPAAAVDVVVDVPEVVDEGHSPKFSNGKKFRQTLFFLVSSFCLSFSVCSLFQCLTLSSEGGSPGPCSKGCEFKSWHRILDGQFSHLFVVKL